MAKLQSKMSQKVGMPPGSLVYTGEKVPSELKITLIEYSETTYQEKTLASIDQCPQPDNRNTVTWLNVNGLHNLDNLKKIGEFFSIHPLILEDICNPDQRPKIDDFSDYLYLVCKILSYDQDQGEITSDQLNLIIGKNYVISLHENDEEVFNSIKERLKARGRIRKSGADYLAYAIIDLVVDHYFLILELLGETIESLEAELVTAPSPETLREIHRLKRDMIILRRSVWPLREVLSQLERQEFPLIQATTAIYLKDVYDHVIQVIDGVETFREMLTGMLDVYLSSISNRMNEVMKVLTIIATIFIPLTFVAGVYGMNFKYMPELERPWGYFAVLVLMALLAGGLIFYFKKKKWLGGS